MVDAKRAKTVLALIILWFVWGSTYLAVAWILPAIPPWILSSVRFLVAAPLLAVGALVTGAPVPTLRQARSAAVVGAFLFLGGNGLTVWAQTRVASGLTAVFVGLVPLWLVLLAWWFEGSRPTPRRLAGLALGLVGVAGIVGVPGRVDPIGVASILAGSVCWATGSMFARRLELPESVFWATSIEILAGGLLLGLVAVCSGQLADLHLERVDGRVVLSFLWLVVGGSLAALVAYNHLLRTTSPAVATTYAYVNPLVAVWLGWWLGGELLSAQELVCSGLIVGAVALVVQPEPLPRLTPT